MTRRQLLQFASSLALVGCGLQGAPPTRATLKVIAVPPTARVYVDERFVASAQVLEGRPRALRPGKHYVTVQAPGYFPHDLEVDLTAGETVLRIRLEPVPPK